jgi:hypothetical protein
LWTIYLLCFKHRWPDLFQIFYNIPSYTL